MQRYLFILLMALCGFSLTSCQSNLQGSSYLFSAPSFSPQVNLTQSVQDALLRQNDPMISQVHVETQQNIVILSGYVKKIRQSDTAELIARQVPGVQAVENRIIIRP